MSHASRACSTAEGPRCPTCALSLTCLGGFDLMGLASSPTITLQHADLQGVDRGSGHPAGSAHTPPPSVSAHQPGGPGFPGACGEGRQRKRRNNEI